MRTLSCPVFATCGGCPHLETSPAERMEAHANRLRDNLRSTIGDAAAHLPIQVVTLPQARGYRRRIRLRVVDGSRLGFFNPEKSEICAVLTPSLRDVMSRLMRTAAEFREALRPLQHVELREPDDEGMAAAYFVKRESNASLSSGAADALGVWLAELRWAIDNEDRPIPSQRLSLPWAFHYVPVSSFLQVNRAVNHVLVQDLVACAELRGISTFCDLYAGSGNFALPLLARGMTGHAVEIDAKAVVAARLAASTQGLPVDGFIGEDSGIYAREAGTAGRSFDMVIIDPPRAGVKQHLDVIAELSREYIVYCSCNPTTLLRDLVTLRTAGFRIESITLYDMFAYTSHVESLVWLRRA